MDSFLIAVYVFGMIALLARALEMKRLSGPGSYVLLAVGLLLWPSILIYLLFRKII